MRESRLCGIAALAAVLVLWAGGCWEDSGHKATKKLAAANEKALAAARAGEDLAKVRKELEKSLAEVGEAGPVADTAVLINANLICEEAEQVRGRLVEERRNVVAAADEIAAASGRGRELESAQTHLKNLLAVSDKEVGELRGLLDGDEQKAGLKKQLAERQSRFEKLQAQKKQLQDELSDAKDRASELRRQSDNLMRQAEAAGPRERIRLHKEAYNLLLGEPNAGKPGRTGWLAKAQEASDGVELAERELAMLAPQKEKLTADINAIEKLIADIKGSPNRGEMKKQIGELSSKAAEHQQEMSRLISRLEKAEGDYHEGVEKTTELLGLAEKQYRKVTSSQEEGIAKTAGISGAGCLFTRGLVYSDYMRLQGQLGTRLKALTGGADASTARALKGAADTYTAKIGEYAQKAMESYEQALKAYEKLQRYAGRKDEFGASMLRNQIVMLAEKARLCAYTGNEELKKQALEQARELAGRAKLQDPNFDSTITADFLGGIE